MFMVIYSFSPFVSTLLTPGKIFKNWFGETDFFSIVKCVCVCACLVFQSCPTLCNTMDCSPPGSSVHGILQTKSTGVGFHALLQGIFPTRGLNPCLQHCRRILYRLSLQGSHGGGQRDRLVQAGSGLAPASPSRVKSERSSRQVKACR